MAGRLTRHFTYSSLLILHLHSQLGDLGLQHVSSLHEAALTLEVTSDHVLGSFQGGDLTFLADDGDHAPHHVFHFSLNRHLLRLLHLQRLLFHQARNNLLRPTQLLVQF